VGGLTYLNALAQNTPSAANIRRYAEIVRDRGVLRKLITVSDEIAGSAFNLRARKSSKCWMRQNPKFLRLLKRARVARGFSGDSAFADAGGRAYR
jgi:replicative DNA helicase